MRVAILGAGHMGRAVGARLLGKGHEVRVWNRTPGRTGQLEKLGAVAVSSSQEAVESAQVVLMLLTADAAVRSVALGEQGVVNDLGLGSVLVDMSTVSPDTSRELGRATPGDRFVDAPILGGPEATESGRAKLLLGGDGDVVDSLNSLWKDVSAEYYYCGPNGTATTLKLLSNLMLVGGTILLGEAVATAQANGLESEVLRTVLKNSPAVAPGVAVRFEDVLEGDHEGWWTIRLAEKDMDLALTLARSKNLSLPVGQASMRVLEAADEAGYGEKDLGAVVEPIRGEGSSGAKQPPR